MYIMVWGGKWWSVVYNKNNNHNGEVGNTNTKDGSFLFVTFEKMEGMVLGWISNDSSSWIKREWRLIHV